MRLIETRHCVVLVPDDLSSGIRPREWAAIYLIANGAMPEWAENRTFVLSRNEHHNLVMSRLDDDEVLVSFVLITPSGIRDSGILVYERKGRRLVRTDHGEIIGWRIPAGYEIKED